MSLWYIGITVCFLSSSVHEKLPSFFYVSKKDFLRPENPYNVTLEKLWTILNKKAIGNWKFFVKILQKSDWWRLMLKFNGSIWNLSMQERKLDEEIHWKLPLHAYIFFYFYNWWMCFSNFPGLHDQRVLAINLSE